MNKVRSGKIAAPTKHLEKARGMKRAANKLLRRDARKEIAAQSGIKSQESH